MCRTMQSWHERCPRFVWIAGVALLAVVLTGDLTRAFVTWTDSQGWEYEWIAHDWAAGEGFSLQGKHRWLFDPDEPSDQTDPDGYYATAWEEPVPVFLLGTFFWLFGDHGRLAMTVANTLFLAATVVVIYHLGRWIQGRWLGLIAAALLMLIPNTHRLVSDYLGNSLLSGLLVGICALVLLWFLERVSLRRGLLLGGVIGLTILTQAAAVVFIPAAVILTLLTAGPLTWRAWRLAGAVVGAALLVISPWTLRNYTTFGELVLVRNGGGLIAHFGNPALAETFDPSLIPADASFTPPWTAPNVLQAVRRLGQLDNRRALRRYSQETVRAGAPEKYAGSNEAQRDKALMHSAVQFMLGHPLLTLQLATIKIVHFLGVGTFRSLHWTFTAVMGLLALLGSALSFKDRKLMAIALMAAGYVAVYGITFPLHYRYRYAIEPIFAILAGVAVVRLAQAIWHLRKRYAGGGAADPA